MINKWFYHIKNENGCNCIVMKRVIEVKVSDGKVSKVVIGDVLSTLSEWLPTDKRIIVITDANIHRNYQSSINKYENIIIGLGETSKTLQTVEKVCSQLIDLKVDRECFILGIGGGIVTDITGFIASIYMRGIRFGFIATTLLSQVDASIGGKNGVNLNGYKNMIGVFNQPEFVLCDTAVLKTLPDREFKAGMAEIIKSAMIADHALFEKLEGIDTTTIKGDSKLLAEIITSASEIKANIVMEDETEQGVRKKLNLGHTFAHAIEKCSQDALHGEAVAIGVVIISDLSLRMGNISKEYRTRVVNLLTKFELPTTTEIPIPKLLKALQSDKKRSANGISIILPVGFGDCDIVHMNFDELNSHFI